MCQSLTDGTDTSKMFAAEIPVGITDNQSNFTYRTNMSYNGDASSTNNDVGSLKGDQWCTMASGITRLDQKIFVDEMADGSYEVAKVFYNAGFPYEFTTSSTITSDMTIGDVTIPAGSTVHTSTVYTDPIVFGTTMGTDGNYGNNVGVQPMGACSVSYDNPDQFHGYKCTENEPQYCWTPDLCRGMSAENFGSIPTWWSKDIELGRQCRTDKECYEGGAYCTTEAPCGSDTCGACHPGCVHEHQWMRYWYVAQHVYGVVQSRCNCVRDLWSKRLRRTMLVVGLCWLLLRH